MATEQKRPAADEDKMDEPTEEEIEREKRSTPDWKHDYGKELSERDQERPLKP